MLKAYCVYAPKRGKRKEVVLSFWQNFSFNQLIDFCDSFNQFQSMNQLRFYYINRIWNFWTILKWNLVVLPYMWPEGIPNVIELTLYHYFGSYFNFKGVYCHLTFIPAQKCLKMSKSVLYQLHKMGGILG